MPLTLPASWKPALASELKAPYFSQLRKFVEAERKKYTVYPPEKDVFNAFKYTPYDEVKAVLLGQDPYHGPKQAHGLCFSVRPEVRPPPSLVNIFKELQSDVGCRMPNNGYLVSWAKQGVLMLNTVLTVRAGEPLSHRGKGWEQFTDAVIRKLGESKKPIVFVLWGGPAQKKTGLIDTKRHPIVKSAHPSPLSAYNGFFGSRPFSKINAALRKARLGEIDWQIQDV